MTQVGKWASDMPPLLKFIAPFFASYVCSYDDDFKETRERRLNGRQYQVDRLSLWFKQYHTFHGEWRRLLKSCWKELLQIPAIQNDQGRALSLVYVLSQKAYESERDNAPAPPELVTMIREIVDEGEMDFQFFAFVMLPCLLLYRQYPITLYRRARKGDIRALKKLLSLDPYLLHNPRIGRVVQRLRFTYKRSQYNALIEASMKQPSFIVNRKKWLKSCAGLLSLLSPLCGKQLNEPEIRAFLNAVAFDTKRQRKDPDLPERHDTFRRQILSERNAWRKGIDPDRKYFK